MNPAEATPSCGLNSLLPIVDCRLLLLIELALFSTTCQQTGGESGGGGGGFKTLPSVVALNSLGHFINCTMAQEPLGYWLVRNMKTAFAHFGRKLTIVVLNLACGFPTEMVLIMDTSRT